MNTLPTWSGGVEEEYETQLFGFGAQRLKISVRQMIDQKIRTGIKDMNNYLQDSLDLNDTDKQTLTRSLENLSRLYCERAGPSLGMIDNEIERMLKVPENVLLPEDEVQLEQVSDEEYNNLKEEVAALKNRVERAALMEALLKAEYEELSSIENMCEVSKKDMEVVDLIQKDVENNENIKTIESDVQFLSAMTPFILKGDELDFYYDKDK